MGHKLYREILDYAPDDWTTSERLVAWVIADDARDATRVSWIPNELLCKKTGLRPVAVRKVLRQLAARGYEMRVSHGEGKDGRPVFAARGHRTDYVVPGVDTLIAATAVTPKPAPEPVDNPAGRRDTSNANGHQKGVTPVTKGVTNLPKGVTAVTPLPSDPLTIPSTSKAEPDLALPVENTRDPPGPPRFSTWPATAAAD